MDTKINVDIIGGINVHESQQTKSIEQTAQAQTAVISPENFSFITSVEIQDIPWHRLTTPYARATYFPHYLTSLWKMQGSLNGIK